MAKLVWKQLKPADSAAFLQYLDGMPEEERPQYGLVGVKASWWTRLGGGARPFVVLFAAEKVTLSQRSLWRHRELSRREYPIGDLQAVSVRRGPLLESARFSFADGYSVRVGSLPRRQARPIERLLTEGGTAFDLAHLSAEQLTNTYLACDAMGLLPEGAA